MNKSIIFLIAILSVFTGQAQDAEKAFTSSIKKATVFPQGAQVTREGKGTVPAGKTSLVFTGISPSINVNSIRFNGKGNFTILSVSHRLNYFKSKEIPANIKKLEKEKEVLIDKKNEENVRLQVFGEEEGVIIANKNITGQQNGTTAAAVRAMADFYRERLLEIKLARLAVNKKLKGIQTEISKINQQVNELRAGNQPKATSEIIIAVTADKSTAATFSLDYLVSNAGWIPSYDLRIEDVNQPVDMTYKAKVYQNSGEDWKNVHINLATGNPTRGGTKPTITTWWLREYYAYKDERRARPKMKMAEKKATYAMDDMEVEEEVTDAGYASVEQVERSTFVEFAIKVKQTIPANGKHYDVNIANYELPAHYTYYAAPKLDKNAFLTARVTDWEEYNLLNGEANLFFEGTYLGASALNVESTNDTLELSLGRDANIVITRTKDKQFKDKKFLSKKVTKTIGWDIEIRNKKKQPVSIVIEDQIPISTTDVIEVELLKWSKAKFNKSMGVLRWEFDLGSKAKKELGFRYKVKYPKNMNLILE